MPHSFPSKGTALPQPGADQDLQERLLTRRSVTAANLGEPGPDRNTLERILASAVRVPDHGKLTPWRLIVLQDEARSRLGDVLAEAFRRQNPDAKAKLVEFERNRFTRVPVVVAVVSSPTVPHPKIPEWEQILSAGAVCQNLLLAAGAHGFSGQWLSEWYAYDGQVLDALGLTPHEKIAGFVYLGTAQCTPVERDRPDMAGIVRYMSGSD